MAKSSLNSFCLSLSKIVLATDSIFIFIYSENDSIPWSIILRNNFLTSFFIELIIIIFFITEILLRSCGLVYNSRELEEFSDLLNFENVVRYVTWDAAIFCCAFY